MRERDLIKNDIFLLCKGQKYKMISHSLGKIFTKITYQMKDLDPKYKDHQKHNRKKNTEPN